MKKHTVLLQKIAKYSLYLIGFFILSAFVNWVQAPKATNQAFVNLPVTTLDGKAHLLSTAQGKTTVVYFFAPWCTVCKLSIDAVNWFEGSSRVQAVAVGLDYETPNELLQFQSRVKAPIYAGSSELQKQFQIDRYPTVYILDGNGRVRHTMVGYASRFGIWLRTWL